MNNTVEAQYSSLLLEARRDPNIRGFILTGSRGKGIVTEYSDYDICIIVADSCVLEYREKYRVLSGDIEINVKSLSEFTAYAEWGSDTAWDRYNFTHLKAQVDKENGLIQLLIDKKGSFPAEHIKGFVSGSLDAYINSLYRSLKNHRDSENLGARLDAVESLNFFWNIIFPFHGRLRPYNKYLEWELGTFPLISLPWTVTELISIVGAVMSTEFVFPQQQILAGLEKMLPSADYGSVFDGWGEKLDWMKKYKP